jgi:hypothetical protein
VRFCQWEVSSRKKEIVENRQLSRQSALFRSGGSKPMSSLARSGPLLLRTARASDPEKEAAPRWGAAVNKRKEAVLRVPKNRSQAINTT